MRLISQTGDLDMPYESSVVVRVGELIFAYSTNYDSDRIVMGNYSTCEKAAKVMEMLHRAYHDAVTHDDVSAFRFLKDNEV